MKEKPKSPMIPFDFTPIPHEILDNIIPKLQFDVSVRVLLCICRQFYGFAETRQGNSLKISYKNIMAKTGIGSKSSIAKALQELEAYGIVERNIRTSNGRRISTEYTIRSAVDITSSRIFNEIKARFKKADAKEQQAYPKAN